MKHGIQNGTKRVNVNVEYKELIDKDVCDEGFIWNPSNCECKCDKSYIQIMKTENVGKNQSINQLKNILKILKKQG